MPGELATMKRPEWPGIATAAALICAGTITYAIWNDPDHFKLKDWQTLLAAFIALFGGTLAYQGAMAKVDLDRELSDRQVSWNTKATIVRLQTTLLFLKRNAINSRAYIDKHPLWRSVGMNLDGLGAPRVDRLEDAWENLGWFPPEIAFKIATIRENLIGLSDALKDHKGSTLGPSDVAAIFDMFNRIEDHATTILAWTNPALKDVKA